MNQLHLYETYGKIAWLWSNSNLHKTWTIGLQSRLIIPPLMLGQYIIVNDNNNNPMAYCSWAMFDLEAEIKYILHPNSIRPNDWRSGQRMWMIDFISPFSKDYTLRIKNRLVAKYPNGYLRALRVKQNSKTCRMLTFAGKNLSLAEANLIKTQHLQELREILSNHPSRGIEFNLN